MNDESRKDQSDDDGEAESLAGAPRPLRRKGKEERLENGRRNTTWDPRRDIEKAWEYMELTGRPDPKISTTEPKEDSKERVPDQKKRTRRGW